jgi:hypothetical protein
MTPDDAVWSEEHRAYVSPPALAEAKESGRKLVVCWKTFEATDEEYAAVMKHHREALDRLLDLIVDIMVKDVLDAAASSAPTKAEAGSRRTGKRPRSK